MKALPEALRQIARDLVEKRLWPFAVLLLALAIVVPVLIGRSAPEAAAPASVTSGPPAVAPVETRPTAGEATKSPEGGGGGRVNDPFYDPPAAPGAGGSGTAAVAPSADSTAPAGGESAATAVPKPAATAAPNGTASTAPKGTSSTAEKATAGTPPKDGASTKPGRAGTLPSSVYYRVVVRWGASTLAEPHALARLTPLGGRRDLAALYLGMSRASDATYAIFVLGPNVTSRGDARCRPGTDCRMIGLRAGDTQRFTVRPADGGKPRRYTLRVDTLRTVRTSVTAAAKGRAKVHRAGSSVLRAMSRLRTEAAVLRRARYDQRSGLLRAVREPDILGQPAE